MKEALPILRRLASYLLFFVASTLVFYYVLSLSLWMYASHEGMEAQEALLAGVYLPITYSFVSLGVTLASQALLIGKPASNEKRLYAISLMVFFGIMLGASILILAEGLSSIPTDESSTDPSFFLCGLLPLLVFSASETVYGLATIRSYGKEKAAETQSL
jgi:hypothetical protein